ncbi:MAG: bifunctional pyr operon transcriptional regulator/uracil phosphoribosyltransferase PyrR [Gammaproteobacteria bacterium]
MNADLENVEKLIQAMSVQLQGFLDERRRSDPVITGIHTGGIWVAERLHQLLQIDAPLGQLNIAFYRDDFSRIGMHPHVTPSNLPFDVEDRHIILVDDVLYTGRTIRAAMNELFDYGRPASICLAVLVDRSGRELPVQADITGKTLELKPNEQVKLTGPEPLALEFNSAE